MDIISDDALAAFAAAVLGDPEPHPADQLIAALKRARVFEEPGHQATAAERAGAYEQYMTLRNEFYGPPPAGEQIRNSLDPGGASPLIRRIFGAGRGHD